MAAVAPAVTPYSMTCLIRSRVMPCLFWAALCLVHPAQGQTGAPLVLKPSSLLDEKFDRDTRRQLPTFTESDRIQGQSDFETQLEGNATIRRGGIFIRADKIDYDQERDFVKARGNVYINREGNVYQGPALDMELEAFEGFFTQPQYKLLKGGLHGQGERIDFVNSGNTVMHKATLTSCERKPGPNWAPDWLFKGEKISLDMDRNVGVAEGSTLSFKGVPILPVPKVDFPLNEERKSGLLPPSAGGDNIGGFEYTQPYYVNLAPNRDFTLTPTYWSKRGLRLGTEFRYLEGLPPYSPFMGTARFEMMDKDQLRPDTQRWALGFNHAGLMDPRFASGTLGLNINISRVSDDNYWKDFPFSTATGPQRLHSSDATTSWTKGFFSTSLTVQRWQTLQDLADPTNALGSRITPPFDRAPQLTANYQRVNVGGGFDFMLTGQATRFESNRSAVLDANSQPNCYGSFNCDGSRVLSVAKLSRPFANSYGYVTPKVQVVSRSYQLDAPLASTGLNTASVTVPTVSVDSGVVFERNQFLFGRGWIQTIEPRVFYVNTPYQNQNFLPNYDSGLNAYNFASIFAENTFGGYDRISDSKMVTVGATSRFIDPVSGAEGARFALAQRMRMQQERVVINPYLDTPASAGLNDVLAGASVNLTRTLAVESVVQYNPRKSVYQREMVGARYSPGSYRTLTGAFRTQNNEDGTPYSKQVEMGWQWPLHDLWRGKDEDLGTGRGLGEGRWYSVARLNYSGLDHRMVESVVGFEYDAGCWLGRVVAENQAIAAGMSRQMILFQLDFVGFSRLGTNALGSMRNNVSRYQPLRGSPLPPSRFGNYE